MEDREKEIRHNTQVEAHIMNREPSCNTTHHSGCDCQIQRHVREKLDLLSLIDSLRASQKELVVAAEKYHSATHGVVTQKYGCPLCEAIEKIKETSK